MIDEHARSIGIPEGHKLVRKDFEWLGPDSEKDTEVHTYEELNAAGQQVGKYEVSVVTALRPPFGTRTHITVVDWPVTAGRPDVSASWRSVQ